MGADVIATDVRSVLDNLSHNIHENSTQDEFQRIQVAELAWGNARLLEDFKIRYNASSFDFIFLGDCFYNVSVVYPLLEMLDQLASPDTQIFVCGIARPTTSFGHRKDVLAMFLQIAPSYFDLYLVWTPVLAEKLLTDELKPNEAITVHLPFPLFSELPNDHKNEDNSVRGVWLLQRKGQPVPLVARECEVVLR